MTCHGFFMGNYLVIRGSRDSLGTPRPIPGPSCVWRHACSLWLWESKHQWDRYLTGYIIRLFIFPRNMVYPPVNQHSYGTKRTCVDASPNEFVMFNFYVMLVYQRVQAFRCTCKHHRCCLEPRVGVRCMVQMVLLKAQPGITRYNPSNLSQL